MIYHIYHKFYHISFLDLTHQLFMVAFPILGASPSEVLQFAFPSSCKAGHRPSWICWVQATKRWVLYGSPRNWGEFTTIFLMDIP